MASLEELNHMSKQFNGSDIKIEKIEVTSNALQLLPKYFLKKGFKRPLIVVDEVTDRVAGQSVKQLLDQVNIENGFHVLTSNDHKQVLADEASLVELMIATSQDIDVLVAVGSGTIHDIVRFVCSKMGKSFVSVPTAASVDGFASTGAPLILKGFKQTIQTTAPVAIFADINILAKAPKELTAAGFGDILGKYTSLLDWKISYLVGQEPYYDKAFNITRKSLDACVANIDDIAKGDTKGIEILMNALIDSGLVMLLLGYSRPASGAEHHLSHFWEMDLLLHNKKQLLHGAKVGVATGIISDHYKSKLLTLSEDHLLHLKGNYAERLREHWSEISSLIDSLPTKETVQSYLEKVGGPTTTDQLSISDGLVEQSLKEAHHLRRRCTGLYLINELIDKG